MHTQTYQEPEIHFIKGFAFSVPAEYPQVYRPLNVQMNDHLELQLQNTVRQAGTVDGPALRQIARSILSPTHQSRGDVVLDQHGWSHHRMSMLLEFEVRDQLSITREVLQCFTDQVGITPQGLVNPAMRITPNGRIVISRTMTNGALGAGMSTAVRENQQIIRPVDIVVGGQQGAGVVNAEHGMRPADMLMACQRNHQAGVHDAATILDTRTIASGASAPNGLLVSRSNQSSASFLGKMLTAVQHAANDNLTTDYAGGQSFMYGTASTYANEKGGSLDSSALMCKLNKSTSLVDFGSFSFGEMLALWPGADQRMNASLLTTNHITDNRANADSIGGTTPESRVAHGLSHLVPQLMYQLLMGQVTFTMSNEYPDGQTRLAFPKPCNMLFDNLDPFSATNVFERTMTFDIVPELLAGAGNFNITVNASSVTTNHYTISLNGGVPAEMTAPNYADGKTTAMLAMNGQQTAAAATSIEGVINSAMHAVNGVQQQMIIQPGMQQPGMGMSTGNIPINPQALPGAPSHRGMVTGMSLPTAAPAPAASSMKL